MQTALSKCQSVVWLDHASTKDEFSRVFRAANAYRLLGLRTVFINELILSRDITRVTPNMLKEMGWGNILIVQHVHI